MNLKNIYLAILVAHGSLAYSMIEERIEQNNNNTQEISKKNLFLVHYNALRLAAYSNHENEESLPENEISIKSEYHKMILEEIYPKFLQEVMQENVLQEKLLSKAESCLQKIRKLIDQSDKKIEELRQELSKKYNENTNITEELYKTQITLTNALLQTGYYQSQYEKILQENNKLLNEKKEKLNNNNTRKKHN